MNRRLYIIAGCNGAGKTTASNMLIPFVFQNSRFLNADNIARENWPDNPENKAIEAGRIMLSKIDAMIDEGLSMTIETTLAARSYTKLIDKAHRNGYDVMLVFFWLKSPEIALQRVMQRVSEGGHNIPEDTILRRYEKGIKNLFNLYIPLCDMWHIYDNSDHNRKPIAKGRKNELIQIIDETIYNYLYEYARQ